MNQILQVQETRKKTSNPVDIKKILLFFAVSLIIFGAILLGQGAYTVYKNSKNKKVEPVTPPGSGSAQEPTYIAPTITLTKTEDNKLIINVASQVAISHIIYNWNNEVSATLNEEGKTNIEEIIEIPAGENIINISVIDSNGKETKKQETYVIEQSKPIIELSVVGSNIKIKVTSKVELSYITYKWNSETENKDDMKTYEDKTKFETQLKIPIGQNTLKIVAVDKNNIISEKTQEVKGIKEVPKLKDPTLKRIGEYIYFTFEAEENMKSVEFIFNGQSYLMNQETFGITKTVKYRVKMIPGWNYLKLIGTTENGAQNTSIWKYEYKTQ